MSAHGVERCIGVALLLGLALWLCVVAWLCWRDERRLRWLQDEADAEEFVRALREHLTPPPAFFVPPRGEHRAELLVLDRRARWLRRRIAQLPPGRPREQDRRELDALEWALSRLRAAA